MQVFVTKLAIEAFAQAVLPRRTRFDIQRADALLAQPILDRQRDELRTVIAANTFGHAVNRKKLRQRVDRVFARNAAANLDAQAKPRVFVDNI